MQISDFQRRFVPVWCVGLLGVLALLLQEPPAATLEQVPELRELPRAALKALLILNPLILTTVCALVGAAVAHRVHLRSRLAGDSRAELAPRLALLVSLGVAVILTSVDALLAGALGEDWASLLEQARAAPQLPALLTGVLYGGLAEETMMRWGVMSLVAWMLWVAYRRWSPAASEPSAGIVWAAIVVAALVFAAGHLPVLAQSIDLSAALVARTLGLNTLAGLAYGWLFWRKGLESAMLAHGATHVWLALARALS